MPKRRPERIPQWMLVLNGAHPFTCGGHVVFVRPSALPRCRAEYEAAGYVDAAETRRGKIAFGMMAYTLERLPQPRRRWQGTVQESEFSLAMSRMWSATRDLFDLARTPLSLRYWPMWLPLMRIGNRPVRSTKSQRAVVVFPSVRLVPRDELDPADRIVAEVVGQFLGDLCLLLAPLGERDRVVRCQRRACDRCGRRSCDQWFVNNAVGDRKYCRKMCADRSAICGGGDCRARRIRTPARVKQVAASEIDPNRGKSHQPRRQPRAYKHPAG